MRDVLTQISLRNTTRISESYELEMTLKRFLENFTSMIES